MDEEFNLPKCKMCGTTETLQIHHLKPLSKGGNSNSENTVYLCKSCHVAFTDSFGSSVGVEKSIQTVASIYLGAYSPYWNRFKEICRKERVSASSKLVNYIRDYVIKHDPTNPQKHLNHFTEDGAITLQTQESLIRQGFLRGEGTSLKKILQVLISEGVNPKERASMGKRIASWLKDKGIEVTY